MEEGRKKRQRESEMKKESEGKRERANLTWGSGRRKY